MAAYLRTVREAKENGAECGGVNVTWHPTDPEGNQGAEDNRGRRRAAASKKRMLEPEQIEEEAHSAEDQQGWRSVPMCPEDKPTKKKKAGRKADD